MSRPPSFWKRVVAGQEDEEEGEGAEARVTMIVLRLGLLLETAPDRRVARKDDESCMVDVDDLDAEN